MTAKKVTKKRAAKVRKPALRKMSLNVPEEVSFSADKENAVVLIAEDRLSDELIAAEVGVDRRTLTRWRLEPPFAARVEQIKAEIREKLVAQGIAARQNRIDAYNDRWKRMQKVIDGRAVEHAGYAGGGATGLLVRQLKVIGKGEEAQTVEEYSVDTPLLREMREHEKQAAMEVGDWTDNTRHSFDLTGLTNEELLALAEIRRKLPPQP